MKLHFATCATVSLLALPASSAEILVGSDIAVSTTWTSDNTYNLTSQVFVLPGATLTIEPGTVIASTPSANGAGSLAVARGAQIFAAGTADAPIIMTSTADVATWTNGDPRTGAWREAAGEWGNLTLLGRAFISEDSVAGNVPTCAAFNEAEMEGLTPSPGLTRYGGGDDDEDSGTLAYVSLRYTGRVLGFNNELNGLSLGGVGRGTDIHHIEIMNGVDDGIEVWGGTVNLRYFSIWNVGDDCFDVDQGWRGKAQFGLLVQGYSLNATQGSGVGDNVFELDGAENSDWQPVTTATIYNCTVIGQPLSGDGATAWRDGARVQFRNCIFMDVGERIVREDNTDGDGGNGYGAGGTLSFADVWDTDWNAAPAHPNDCPPAVYAAQSSGKLAEITDSLFFRNINNAYIEATARGVFDAGANNVLLPGVAQADVPFVALERGPLVTLGSLFLVPVTYLDPRPRGPAIASVSSAPDDGFFQPAPYRGAFAPSASGATWLSGWTASSAYGFTPRAEREEDQALLPDSGDFVGPAVTVSGDLAVLGTSQGDGGAPESGCAIAYERVSSVWQTPVLLCASDAEPGDLFGGALSIDGSRVLISAVGEDALGPDAGAAYVFDRSGASWSEAAKLTASDGAAGRRFGRSLSLSGNRALVGTLGGDSAYVFEENAGVWTETARLSASDGTRIGYSVCLDGDRAIVGSLAGAAFVFEWAAGTWVEGRGVTRQRDRSLRCLGGARRRRRGRRSTGRPGRGGQRGLGARVRALRRELEPDRTARSGRELRRRKRHLRRHGGNRRHQDPGDRRGGSATVTRPGLRVRSRSRGLDSSRGPRRQRLRALPATRAGAVDLDGHDLRGRRQGVYVPRALNGRVSAPLVLVSAVLA